ncbi:MAG: hypothetical protein SVY15_05235 [Halobacteriota archaeon]|nr:hypothetical protein [Halobacteriota archaeon]
MRKIFFILMLLTLIAAVPTTSALSVGEVQFDKMPLAPGESTDVWVEITNYGEDKSDIVILLDYHTVGLTGESPASEAIGILDGSSGIKELKKGESNDLHYKIFVAPDAKEGIYNLDLVSRYQTEAPDFFGNNTYLGSSDTIATISVQVEEEKPHIMVSTSNTIFAPGSTGVITLTLKNMGDGLAEDTILEINPIPREEGDSGDSDILGMLTEMVGFSMPSFSTGGSGEEAKEIPPFTVADSGTRFYIGDLKRRQSVDLSIKMAADPEIAKGNYNIPITIRTKDGSSTSEYVGVRVLSKADLIVPQTKTEPKELAPGVTAIYMVTVENIGQNDAKSTSVTIDNEYLSGRMIDYIGRIEAEDESTAMFEIEVIEDTPSTLTELPVVINITYQDDTGDHLSIEKGEIRLKDDGGNPATSNSDYATDLPLMGIGIAILIILLIIFVGKWKDVGPFKKKVNSAGVNNYAVTVRGKEIMDDSNE